MGKTLRQMRGQPLQPPVVLLVDLRRARHEQPDHVPGDFFRPHAQFLHQSAQPLRRHRPARQRPRRAGRLRRGAGEAVTDTNAVQTLRRVRGEPADDMRFPTRRVENVPHRPAAARRARHQHGLAEFGVHLREPVDAVLVGPFARGDGVPQHRREHRADARQVAHDAAPDDV